MSECPLKVLLLAGPFQVRGTHGYTLRLAGLLRDQGVQPAIVTPDASRVEEITRHDLGIQIFPNLDLPVWDRVVLHGLADALADDPPDLIHVQVPRMLRQANWLSQHLECPYVVTVHEHPTARERLRFNPERGRRIIALSDSLKTVLQRQMRLPDEVFSVIPGGVDAQPMLHSPPVLDPEHVPVVGTAGPLEAVKGQSFFLEAARRVVDTHEDVQFLIAGAGPEEQNLRRLATQLGVSRHTTFIPNLFDFEAALAAMDVFCLPSLRQGMGTIMLQAMALGKPVVASGVDAVSTVVENNQNGLTVPPRDSVRLAERIRELLDDPVRARALGESGRRMIRERFSAEQMVMRTVELYHAALGLTNGAVAAVQANGDDQSS